MTIFYFVLAAIALGILVFIHELGHYFAAKWMGMTVETFSIGFGRPLLKWRWNDVDWQLGWLPFGGFVKIAGMEFGKKEKGMYNEPYEIPNGFFSKAPWRRIVVALAGPVANFILAFLLFTALWGMGGREKPFSEFTKIIGWVDPSSELFALNVRPGDLITSYNGHPYTNSKDLLYAAMLSGKKIAIQGAHVNYAQKEITPFNYSIETYQAANAIGGILTTGITAGASYLIYQDHSANGTTFKMSEGSPMENSGIEPGDRLVWADGELLFSLDELSYLLNRGHAFLTVARGNYIYFTRQPRVAANELRLPPHIRNELIDWQFELGIDGRWQDLFALPYVINTEGYIEAPLDFIDEESRLKAFPAHRYSEEQPLKPGDRILAVDGTPVQKGYQILQQLQTHRVSLIVQKNVPLVSDTTWKKEDEAFLRGINFEEIEAIAKTIGTDNPVRGVGNYKLLAPVEPKRVGEFIQSKEAKALLESQIAARRKEIEEIRDKEKRNKTLQEFEKNQERLLLGVYLQDRKVTYNPSPWSLFKQVFVETWMTLKALIMGYLHLKWLSGPVGIVQVIHQGWTIGIGEALFWIGAISLNLGVLNLLPIPVLDGGYITLSLWEMITRRRLKAKTMERIIIPFVVLLIALLVFLTFQDISRFF